MTIDFSWSKDDWLALIREFLETVQNFFDALGIELFSEESTL